MDVLWLLIGILIGWISAWAWGLDRHAQNQTEAAMAPESARGLHARKRLRYHVLRAVVTLVLVGIILTVWSMRAATQP